MSGTRHKGEKVIWRCYIPVDLAVEIELLLADPLRDKPIYGARSQLVSYLLQRHLEEIRNPHHQKEPSNVNH